MISIYYRMAIDPVTECILQGLEVFLTKNPNIEK